LRAAGLVGALKVCAHNGNAIRADWLFSDTRAGLFWLPIRLFLGFQWLDAGLHKFGDSAWMGGGTALKAIGSAPWQSRRPVGR